jgi:hypothetical protein
VALADFSAGLGDWDFLLPERNSCDLLRRLRNGTFKESSAAVFMSRILTKVYAAMYKDVTDFLLG